MSRSILPMLTLAVASIIGCSVPADTEVLKPFIAVAGAYGVQCCLPAPAPEPPAPPKPKPAVCAVCGGKGYLGDGTIRVPCPSCKPKTKECESCVIHPRIIVR